MIVDQDPYLIEYNVRMGDPECQVIMPRLKSDLLKLLILSVNNQLKKAKISWRKQKSMTIVLCSKGYPGKYSKLKIIKNLRNINLKNEIIYHAGTKFDGKNILSNGGRVLNITSTGNNFSKIRKKLHKIIYKINWKEGFFRKDIGWRVIK